MFRILLFFVLLIAQTNLFAENSAPVVERTDSNSTLFHDTQLFYELNISDADGDKDFTVTSDNLPSWASIDIDDDQNFVLTEAQPTKRLMLGIDSLGGMYLNYTNLSIKEFKEFATTGEVYALGEYDGVQSLFVYENNDWSSNTPIVDFDATEEGELYIAGNSSIVKNIFTSLISYSQDSLISIVGIDFDEWGQELYSIVYDKGNSVYKVVSFPNSTYSELFTIDFQANRIISDFVVVKNYIYTYDFDENGLGTASKRDGNGNIIYETDIPNYPNLDSSNKVLVDGNENLHIFMKNNQTNFLEVVKIDKNGELIQKLVLAEGIISKIDSDGSYILYQHSLKQVVTVKTYHPNIIKGFPTQNDIGTHTIDFSVSDGIDSTTSTVDITVLDKEYPPVLHFEENETISLTERITTSFYDVNATDPDLTTDLTLSISGTDSQFFTIENNGSLSTSQSLEYISRKDKNGDSIYELNVTATDGTGLSSTKQLYIYVVGEKEIYPFHQIIIKPFVEILNSISGDINMSFDEKEITVHLEGKGELLGTTSINAKNGIAQFTDLSYTPLNAFEDFNLSFSAGNKKVVFNTPKKFFYVGPRLETTSYSLYHNEDFNKLLEIANDHVDLKIEILNDSIPSWAEAEEFTSEYFWKEEIIRKHTNIFDQKDFFKQDSDGNFYIGDGANMASYEFLPDGTIKIFDTYFQEASGSNFVYVKKLEFDADGNFYALLSDNSIWTMSKDRETFDEIFANDGSTIEDIELDSEKNIYYVYTVVINNTQTTGLKKISHDGNTVTDINIGSTFFAFFALQEVELDSDDNIYIVDKNIGFKNLYKIYTDEKVEMLASSFYGYKNLNIHNDTLYFIGENSELYSYKNSKAETVIDYTLFAGTPFLINEDGSFFGIDYIFSEDLGINISTINKYTPVPRLSISGYPTQSDVGQYTVQVKISDGINSVEEDIEISVLEREYIPQLMKTEFSLPENDSTLSFDVDVTDFDDEEIQTFEIIKDDYGLFYTDPNEKGKIIVDGEFDYEKRNMYSLTVRFSSIGYFAEEDITIKVIDVNEAPTDIYTSTPEIIESQEIEEDIFQFKITDPDTNNDYSLELCGGVNDDFFQIAGYGNLQLLKEVNYETMDELTLCVKATDVDGFTIEKNITLQIKDALEYQEDGIVDDMKNLDNWEVSGSYTPHVFDDNEGKVLLTPAENDKFGRLKSKFAIYPLYGDKVTEIRFKTYTGNGDADWIKFRLEDENGNEWLSFYIDEYGGQNEGRSNSFIFKRDGNILTDLSGQDLKDIVITWDLKLDASEIANESIKVSMKREGATMGDGRFENKEVFDNAYPLPEKLYVVVESATGGANNKHEFHYFGYDETFDVSSETFEIDEHNSSKSEETDFIIGKISASQDANFSIVGGDDSNFFNIDKTSGELTFKVRPDYENPKDYNLDNEYKVQVFAKKDNEIGVVKDISISVKDIDE
ncbi:Cadherin domain-containing protein, partial [Thiovulum sp. ES]